MPFDLTESVLEREGCPLHYWVGGAEQRPLVVFTHGACVDHHSFDGQIALVAEHYRVLTWDVRGHGLSQPMGGPFTVPRGVDDLLALVEALGYETAIYVGHSNGSYIAQELAFRHPERVQALVVADGTCITWEHSRLELFAIRAAPAIGALLPFETLKKSSLSMNSARADVRDYVYRAFSQIPKREFIEILSAVTRGLHPEPGYRITQPLLLTHGDADRLGDVAVIAPKWAAREPNCTYAVIPNARHFSMMDNPDAFNRLLLDFLARWAE